MRHGLRSTRETPWATRSVSAPTPPVPTMWASGRIARIRARGPVGHLAAGQGEVDQHRPDPRLGRQQAKRAGQIVARVADRADALDLRDEQAADHPVPLDHDDRSRIPDRGRVGIAPLVEQQPQTRVAATMPFVLRTQDHQPARPPRPSTGSHQPGLSERALGLHLDPVGLGGLEPLEGVPDQDLPQVRRLRGQSRTSEQLDRSDRRELDAPFEPDRHHRDRRADLALHRRPRRRLPDGVLELLQVEGLLEQAQNALSIGLLEQVSRGEAGDEDRIQPGMQRAKDLGDVQSVYVALQHPVRDQHVGHGFDARFQGLVARGGRDHVVPLVGQVAAQRLAKRVLVFHDDDRRHGPVPPYARIRPHPTASDRIDSDCNSAAEREFLTRSRSSTMTDGRGIPRRRRLPTDAARHDPVPPRRREYIQDRGRSQ